MPLLYCCCFRGCQEGDDSEDEGKKLSDFNSNNYHEMLQNLCKELEKKKAELERLENHSEDSEDIENLMRYGGQGEGRRRRKRDRVRQKQERQERDNRSREHPGVTTRRNINNNRIGRIEFDEELLVEIPLDDDNEATNGWTKIQEDDNSRRYSIPDVYAKDVEEGRDDGLLCGWDKRWKSTKGGYKRTSL